MKYSDNIRKVKIITHHDVNSLENWIFVFMDENRLEDTRFLKESQERILMIKWDSKLFWKLIEADFYDNYILCTFDADNDYWKDERRITYDKYIKDFKIVSKRRSKKFEEEYPEYFI